jgi:hypothetical protein
LIRLFLYCFELISQFGLRVCWIDIAFCAIYLHRVTKRVREKLPKMEPNPFFGMEKELSVIFKNLTKSPNSQKLAQSGHPRAIR